METDLIKNLDKIHTTELGAGRTGMWMLTAAF